MVAFIESFAGQVFYLGAFIVALSIIVTVHEFGHYIVGRWSGIHAEVFSVGFGPILASRVDKRGTRWQVAAVPLGGYVKFLGDANAASAGADEETMSRLSDTERRHTMHGAPLWARAATVFAGPFFNFILATIIFAGFVLVRGIADDTPTIVSLKPLPVEGVTLLPGDRIVAVEGTPVATFEDFATAANNLPPAPLVRYGVEREGERIEVMGPQALPPLISGVAPKSAAIDAGLQAGDVIVSVDGTTIWRFEELRSRAMGSQGAPLSLVVWRDGETFDTTLVPRERPVQTEDGGFEMNWQIGIYGDIAFDQQSRRASPWEAAVIGVQATFASITGTISSLVAIVAGSISSCSISGAIGIAQAAGAAASQGWDYFIGLVASLSVAIGFLNLLPIPVLDGGHLIFHAYEWARGKPPSDRAMNLAMSVGLILVIALMVFGLSNDILCT
ncbi:RIP metalloprotease RseP [Defluviimonas sp. WL0002]|uniref:Zinc metalloprotease n=1 Tax=Albidovulum marisflavi TaxID=2984159 RepID=A0ABT2ZG23_9RHOB|nr:RIP metalloprotease RseP [Defluviimonas sp. WL0002]MCV2870080.1 RIP metalloprotease RseP [Defluviimonas sp. WL0002]